MKNVQLIAELLLIILDKKIVGFNQEYLDDMFAYYDSPDETVENFDEEVYKTKKNSHIFIPRRCMSLRLIIFSHQEQAHIMNH